MQNKVRKTYDLNNYSLLIWFPSGNASLSLLKDHYQNISTITE